jgi:hypothetical protein
MKVGCLILILALAGCAARQQSQNVHAAAVDSVGSFDEKAYAALTASHALIERTKVELSTSETYPTSVAVNVSHALAYLMDAHEVTQHAYMAYRKSVIAGGDSRAEFDALAARLHDLDVKTKVLEAAKKGG